MSIVSDNDEPGAGATADLSVVVEQYELRGVWVISVRGDLDLDSIPPMRAALEASASTHAVTVLDTSEVTFADSSTLNLLLEVAGTATLRVAAASGPLLRLLRITGADQILDVRSSVAEAAGG